jgi:hypothetical protein
MNKAGERLFKTQAAALMDALEEMIFEGGGTVVVCVGEECPFRGDDAVANQESGCPICRRIEVSADGSTREFRRLAN